MCKFVGVTIVSQPRGEGSCCRVVFRGGSEWPGGRGTKKGGRLILLFLFHPGLEFPHPVVKFPGAEFEVELLLSGAVLEFHVLFMHPYLGVGVYSEYCADEGEDCAEDRYDRGVYCTYRGDEQGEYDGSHSEGGEYDAEEELCPFPCLIDVFLFHGDFSFLL